jgi:hypothetical protein
VLALVAAGCGGDDDDTAEPAVPTTTTTTTVAATTTTAVPAEPAAVLVYFLDADAHLATAGRTVTDDPAVGALEALLAGPVGIEADLGFASAIPAGTELLGLETTDGVTTVDLSGAFETGGGSASMLGRVAQVVYTLTQFDGVESVRFELDGVPVEAIGGEGVIVDGDGVDRTAFDAVLPMIFVESPTPGEEVTSPITLSGVSNTFEATVNYTLTDPEGLILEEGFTMGGTTGTFGSFDTTIDFATQRHGLGALIVYEVSPEDGSHQNVVEIPITM